MSAGGSTGPCCPRTAADAQPRGPQREGGGRRSIAGRSASLFLGSRETSARGAARPRMGMRRGGAGGGLVGRGVDGHAGQRRTASGLIRAWLVVGTATRSASEWRAAVGGWWNLLQSTVSVRRLRRRTVPAIAARSLTRPPAGGWPGHRQCGAEPDPSRASRTVPSTPPCCEPSASSGSNSPTSAVSALRSTTMGSREWLSTTPR